MQSSRAGDDRPGADRPVAPEEPLDARETGAPDGNGQPPASGARAGVQDLEEQIARLEDRYRRALADLDNYRKRAARETERRIGEMRERLLRDWLEAVDSVERALRVNPDDPGLRAVLAQMDAILAREGVSRVGAVGDAFDPERHEAVAVRASDEASDRTIVDVVRSGFALDDDRVLRPAQVVVAKGDAAG